MSPCLDLFGHLGYVALAVGTWLAGERIRSGWAVRIAGSLAWAAIGYQLGSTSVVFWSLAFAVVDLRNYRRWYDGP